MLSLYCKAINWKYRLGRKLREEKGSMDLVQTIIIIAIVIGLAIIFRNQIKDLIDKVFGRASDVVEQGAEGSFN